jgi:hypothetical protein
MNKKGKGNKRKREKEKKGKREKGIREKGGGKFINLLLFVCSIFVKHIDFFLL